MADKQNERQHRNPNTREREERLAAALRANLARRKAQARQRAEGPSPAAETSEGEG
ncbi:MAG TPA: hypothetical protein VF502_16700 [Stellaceae bacterium]